jgi:hypothetical protein
LAKVKSIKKDKPVPNLSVWWSDLQAVKTEDRNEVWCSQLLYFMKRNGRLLLDPVRAAAYRATDSLQLNERIYRELVDPVTPMGGGGTAEYFSSDWKADPIYLHLKNICKADILKSSKTIEVELTDKYAKTRRMEKNYRILYQGLFRRIINEYAPVVGLPTISDNEDPYKWVARLLDEQGGSQEGTSQVDAQQPATKKVKGKSKLPDNDIIDNFADLIANKITDSEDLALYNELIYKGDYEIAFELGIDYYLNNLNKFQDRWADTFLDDFMHFNKGVGEWYTDLMTGRPVIQRLIPENLWLSPFRQKDFEDGMYYFYEWEISFGDFARTIGKSLNEEQLKRVFLYQKTQGAAHRTNWVESSWVPNNTRDNAMIRVGRAAALAQDLDVQMEDVNVGYPMSYPAPLTWKPLEGDNKKRVEKYYNVWYSWYYIPPTTNSLSNADYAWQAQFTFDIQKNQDQQRFGEDGRYSKSPLILFDNSAQASFTDVTQSYMPMIHHARHEFQNCLVNDFEATIFSDEFIGGLLNAVDEGNKIDVDNPNNPTGGNGHDAMMQQWKMIQQSGKGFLKMTDKNGQLILDPSKLVLNVKNGYLEKALSWLEILAAQYNQMVKALAQSPITTGEEVKPRTPVAALQQSVIATDSGRFYIQKSYEAFIKIYAERMVQYIIQISKESINGYSKRWDEFCENIGYANGLAIQGMADVPPESVGLTIQYLENSARKEFVVQLATEFVKNGQLDIDFLNLILSQDQWKYGYMLMRIGVKEKKKELQQEAAQQQQYIMEQKNADLQIAIAMQGKKTEGKVQEISVQGQVTDAINKALNEYKFESQSALKEQTTVSRISETNNKLQKENEIKLQQPLQD